MEAISPDPNPLKQSPSQSLIRGVAESDRWDKIRISEGMTVQKLANSPDTQAQAKQLSDAIAGWSKRMRAFVVLVKA